MDSTDTSTNSPRASVEARPVVKPAPRQEERPRRQTRLVQPKETGARRLHSSSQRVGEGRMGKWTTKVSCVYTAGTAGEEGPGPRAPSEVAGRYAEPGLRTPNAGVPPSTPPSPEPGVRTEGGGAGEETAAFAAFAEFPETPEIFDSVGVFDPAPRATPLFTSQTRKGRELELAPRGLEPPSGRAPRRRHRLEPGRESRRFHRRSRRRRRRRRHPRSLPRGAPRRRLAAHPPQPRGTMRDPSSPCALNPRRRRPGRRSAFVPLPSGDAARA